MEEKKVGKIKIVKKDAGAEPSTPKPAALVAVDSNSGAGGGGKIATATASIEKKVSTGAKVIENEAVKTPVFLSDSTKDAASVGVSAGFTKNIGDFNSVRVDVSLRVPCDPHMVEPAFTFVSDWVNAKLECYQNEASK